MLSQVVVALLGAQLALVAAQNGVITNDSYFYGDSPKVAPPKGSGTGNWSDAYTKAKAFVAKLTTEEKVNFTAGTAAPNGCSGLVAITSSVRTLLTHYIQMGSPSRAAQLPRDVSTRFRQWC